jgi:hypothetical protein
MTVHDNRYTRTVLSHLGNDRLFEPFVDVVAQLAGPVVVGQVNDVLMKRSDGLCVTREIEDQTRCPERIHRLERHLRHAISNAATEQVDINAVPSA